MAQLCNGIVPNIDSMNWVGINFSVFVIFLI